MTPGEFKALLAKNKLPLAPGPVLDARWVAGRDDWYVLTSAGWYWLSGKTWVPVPTGPL